jgi:hypothetical protein
MQVLFPLPWFVFLDRQELFPLPWFVFLEETKILVSMSEEIK